MLTRLQLRAIREEFRRRHPGDPRCPGEPFTAQELELLVNVEAYKRVCDRPFPTFAEVLAILVALGYEQKVVIAAVTVDPRPAEDAQARRALPRGVPVAERSTRRRPPPGPRVAQAPDPSIEARAQSS